MTLHKTLEYKHNAELQWADSGPKVPGATVLQNCATWIVIIAIVLVEKKKTLNRQAQHRAAAETVACKLIRAFYTIHSMNN